MPLVAEHPPREELQLTKKEIAIINKIVRANNVFIDYAFMSI